MIPQGWVGDGRLLRARRVVRIRKHDVWFAACQCCGRAFRCVDHADAIRWADQHLRESADGRRNGLVLVEAARLAAQRCTCGRSKFQPWHHPRCPQAL